MADEKFVLSFNGKLVENKIFEEDEINNYFRIDKSYQLNADRSDSRKYEEKLSDAEIIQLKTDDGLEWIGYADDIPEIYGDQPNTNRADGVDAYHMIPEIKNRGGVSRGVGDVIKNAVLDIIVSKGAEITAGELAKVIDNKKCPNPGLHKLDDQGRTIPVGKIPFDQICLLLIHGTISSYEDGFANIDPDLWSQLKSRYDGNIYAFNHKTLTESPVENALALLEALPAVSNFDIISHSRGGLVADTLARCDRRNDEIGFSEDDINLIESEFDGEDEGAIKNSNKVARSMRALNELAREKRLIINKVVRVACPAEGTILLSKRLDHFLNAILSLLGMAVGSKLNPIYQFFKLFLLKVVEEKSDPQTFPGLWSMVPGSSFQVINNKNVKLASHLVSIAGDSKIGGKFWHSLKVILTNLYYWRENDFVVNTDSMTKGLSNRKTNVFYKIQNKQVQHFNYFSIEWHMKIVLSALTNQPLDNVNWTSIQRTYDDRGIALKMVDMGGITPVKESGDKPIVILIPGIMGSNIYTEDGRKWLDFHQIHKGALANVLNVDDYNKTFAKSIIKKYYNEFKEYLVGQNHDVVVHPFDWRQSLSESVDDFNKVMTRVLDSNQPVRIVAHSMGGLLVRQWKLEKNEFWQTFKTRNESRFIMLGTPWNGSHLIMEVLTGHSRRVKQLNFLDFKHNKRQILESLVEHKGLYDLLPLLDNTIDSDEKWKELYEAVGSRNMAPIPTSQLKYYRKYKSTILDKAKIEEAEKDIIYYVAGKTDKTLNGYQIKQSFFRGKYIDYDHTEEGDGSVTWETGIPSGLAPSNLYYVNVEHGNLANDRSIFAGLNDLILTGKTNQRTFSTTKLRSGVSRGGHSATVTFREIPLLEVDPIDNIFGTNLFQEGPTVEGHPIEVEVFNGDLKWSKYPVMVGHFVHDGIVSAERAIDRYLNDKLTERHQMGFYPGRIGEQDIIYDHQNSPKGALVIGLGDKDDLTGYNLAQSVEKGVLKYAVFFRDNNVVMDNSEIRTSISTLIIGSNYGKLPMKESIRSILIGIQNANKLIKGFDTLQEITKVEFVDYYEDNAYECYKVLQEIEREKNTVEIILKDEITVGYRNKKRLLRDESSSWWQSFSTELKIDDNCDGRPLEYLDFGTYNRQANASKERVMVNMELARYIADELSTVQEWDPVNSKVIFEMLLPNRYKDFIRNHRNIEWRLDDKAATFPWEMFHDFTFGDKPTFIESGLIRQLYSMDANIRPALVRDNSALVIANPIFKEGGLPPLPGAEAEGNTIVGLLEKNDFTVVQRIKSNPLDIVKSLFSGAFKVLHVASHGLYNIEEGKVGIAIGNGQLLTPGTLNQMTAIPEFVFINCCFSGTIRPEDEAYTKNRNRLAANIGTQLIEMGVKAVVVAGWAVHDGAAKVFANSLYEELLDGAQFGDAVRKARSDCYYEYKKYNTWGAYQCYGDQFYRLSKNRKSENDEDRSALEQEIVMELDNVLSSARSMEISIGDQGGINWISKKMQTLVERAETLGKYSTQVIEREALILAYLGKYAQASLKYEELFQQDDGKFNAENLDIYCNIRAKNLVACTQGKCEITDDTIDKVLSDMNGIKLIGAGPRRLSTIGSTYKRAAMLAKGKTKMRAFLKESAEYYLQAAKLIGFDKRDAIYQLTTFITVATFSDSGLKNKEIDIKENLGTPIKDYLIKWIATADKETSDRTNIYDQLAKIQLRMVAIIVGHGSKKDLTKKIIELYEKQISRSINLKDLIGEIEWIDFHIFMCKQFGGKFKASIPYYEKMKEFLEQYYKRG